MKIKTALINLMEAYNAIPDSKKILLNDYNYYSEVDKSFVQGHLTTTLKTDVISTLPSCVCGEIQNNYSTGVICPRCNTEVISQFRDYDPIIWMRSFDGAPPYINPAFVNYMNDKIKIGMKLIKWFGNRQYNPNLNLHNQIIIDKVKQMNGFERTYSFLVDNFLDVLNVILIHNKKNAVNVMEVINYVKDDMAGEQLIFTHYLPIINRRFAIKENTSKGKYYSPATIRVDDIALTVMRYTPGSIVLRDRCIVNTIESVADLAAETITSFLGTKEGFARQQIMGMRGQMTFRAVVTALCGKHEYDEMTLPWSVACVVLRPYILNKLLKRGYTIKGASKLLALIPMAYDETVSEILDEIIADSFLDDGTDWGERGIKALLLRNPSQNSASFMLMRITEIKKDLRDDSIGLPMLTWPNANGDVDGDQASAKIIEDRYLYDLLSRLRPDTAPLAVSNKTNKVYGKSNIPETMVTGIRNRITYEENT